MKKTILVFVVMSAEIFCASQPNEQKKSEIRQRVEQKYSIIPSHWNGPEDPCCCLAYIKQVCDCADNNKLIKKD